MNRWLRRVGYGTLLIIWLVVMAFPTLAFLLAIRGQVQVGDDGRSHLRLFMINEDDGAGIGVEWSRQAGDNCRLTSVNYLLWEGENQPVRYCQCTDLLNGTVQTIDASQCRR